MPYTPGWTLVRATHGTSTATLGLDRWDPLGV